MFFSINFLKKSKKRVNSCPNFRLIEIFAKNYLISLSVFGKRYLYSRTFLADELEIGRNYPPAFRDILELKGINNERKSPNVENAGLF